MSLVCGYVQLLVQSVCMCMRTPAAGFELVRAGTLCIACVHSLTWVLASADSHCPAAAVSTTTDAPSKPPP
jgi:hypothetical protein